MLAVTFALVTLTLLKNNDIDTVLIMFINNSHLYLSECLNKKIYKSNFQDLWLQSLVTLTKLGA